jgi:hypothetical protein
MGQNMGQNSGMEVWACLEEALPVPRGPISDETAHSLIRH